MRTLMRTHKRTHKQTKQSNLHVIRHFCFICCYFNACLNMGRKRQNLTRNFFNFNAERNSSECKICKTKLDGSYVCNLKRHLKEKHSDIYSSELVQQNNSVVEKKIKFSISFSKNEVKEACVDLVTTEKMPLSGLDSTAFKILTEQIFRGLHMSPITSKNVVELITEKYNEIRKSIQALLKNKIFSLKIDIATRHNRGILGINVQLYNGEQLSVKTIGLIELQKRHTAKNLCSEIENILDEFGIEKMQIYCITTDNGRNMIKAVELLNEGLDDSSGNSDQYDEQLVNDNIIDDLNISSITSIKCAAHSLQLAVKDFLQEIESLNIIDQARKIVKILRTPSYR